MRRLRWARGVVAAGLCLMMWGCTVGDLKTQTVESGGRTYLVHCGHRLATANLGEPVEVIDPNDVEMRARIIEGLPREEAIALRSTRHAWCGEDNRWYWGLEESLDQTPRADEIYAFLDSRGLSPRPEPSPSGRPNPGPSPTS